MTINTVVMSTGSYTTRRDSPHRSLALAALFLTRFSSRVRLLRHKEAGRRFGEPDRGPPAPFTPPPQKIRPILTRASSPPAGPPSTNPRSHSDWTSYRSPSARSRDAAVTASASAGSPAAVWLGSGAAVRSSDLRVIEGRGCQQPSSDFQPRTVRRPGPSVHERVLSSYWLSTQFEGDAPMAD